MAFGISLASASFVPKRRFLWTVLILLASVRVAWWSEKKRAAESVCAAIASGESLWCGSLTPVPGGRWELANPRWERLGEWQEFAGEVLVSRETAPDGPEFGRELEVRGKIRCAVSRRNPGVEQDGLVIWKAPTVRISRARWRVLPESAAPLARFRLAFAEFLDRIFGSAPGWVGVEHAVWRGDLSRLPTELVEFYREAGLLHVLALGGQRIQSLLFVFLLVLRASIFFALPLGGWRYLGRFFPWLRSLLPVAAAGLLSLTTPAAGPLWRVLAMALAVLGLRARRLQSATLQVASSAVACLWIADPSLVGKPGFLLSAGATLLLCQIATIGSWRSAVKAYFAIGLFMPVLVLPLGAFFFARVSWLAPVHGIAIGWIWYWGIAPTAFVAPLLLAVLPVQVRLFACGLLERGWALFLSLDRGWSGTIASGALSVIRPTWGELLLLEALFLALVAACQSRLFPRSLYSRVK